MKKLLSLFLFLLISCSNTPPATPTSPSSQTNPPAIFTAPVLLPTFTPISTPGPLPTFTAGPGLATAPTGTPVNFDETAVELRYIVPAIGLNRRLQAKVGGNIILVDEAADPPVAVEQANQPGILLEIRQALTDLELAPLPEGCDTCVQFRYDLPQTGESGEGWLQDPILLASLENYTAINLGPHFPPDTVVGLRRSASPYAPAHSLALMADGRLWTWLATEDQLTTPTENSALLGLLADLPVEDLAERYIVDCVGMPNETLWLDVAGETQLIRLVCPAYSLPSTLLPLYVELDKTLADKTAEVSLPRPPFGFSLDALLDYRRADGNRLTLYQDNSLILRSTDFTYTTTLTTTAAISLTGNLLESGILQPGLTIFQQNAITPTTTTPVSILLVRGPEGVWDGKWENAADIPALAELDALLDSLLELANPAEVATPNLTETPAPSETETAVTPTP